MAANYLLTRKPSMNVYENHFVVKEVYGAKIIGDVRGADNNRTPGGTNFGISLAQISEKFKNDRVKINDFCNFFLVGDEFNVTWNAGEKRIIDFQLDAKELVKRMPMVSISSPPVIYSQGYVISGSPDGCLIFSKIDGGALVYAPSYTICGEISQNRNELELPSVGVTIKKVIFVQEGPRFMKVAYQAISVHGAASKLTDAYYPAFAVEGAWQCLLDGQSGAIMRINHDITGTPNNANRPVPKNGDTVYCPPWAFVDATQTTRWMEICRAGTLCKCRIVYVAESGLAFGCSWIALGVKRAINYGTYGIGYSTSSINNTEFLKTYQTAERKAAAHSEWDAEEALKRMEVELNSESASQSRSNLSINCRELRKFMAGQSFNGTGESTTTELPGTARKKRSVSVSQTTVDDEFIKTAIEWANDAAMWMPPDDAEEYAARFLPIE